MAKRKQGSNSSKPTPQSSSTKGEPGKVIAPETDKSVKAEQTTRLPEKNRSMAIPTWLWAGLLLLLIVGGGGWWLVKGRSNQTPDKLGSESIVEATAGPPVSTAPVPTAVVATGASYVPVAMGNVTGCRSNPKFVKELGFTTRAFLSTSERTIKGLVLIEPSENNSTERRIYQHPSWSSAGYLGPTLIDKDGYSYVASAPRVDLSENPPEIQDILYRVDTVSQELLEYMRMPSPRPPSQSNPYGILGLTYDCETQSLYVSSIAGSSRTEELGRIYRIDVANKRIAAQLEGVDAIGIGIFNGSKDKRLYYSSARTQEIRSIALDNVGNFVDPPRVDFSLVGLGPNGNEQARRISFIPGNDSNYYMQLNGMKFSYNLAPPPSTASPTIYRFRYDPAKDGWVLSEITQ